MLEPDRRRLGVLLGLAGWVLLAVLARILGTTIMARFILLVAQQAMFVGIGLFCIRGEVLFFPGAKASAKAILYGVGLYLTNVILGTLTLYVFTRLLGSETALQLLAAERAAMEPFLDSGNNSLILGMGLMLIVGAPLSEELFFRGLILDSLKEHVGAGTAVFLAALLFAGLHFYFIQFIPVLAAGILLGRMFIRSENLFLPIVAHAVTNALALAAWFAL